MNTAAETQNSKSVDSRSEHAQSQFLTFWLANEMYGLEISNIKEITEYRGVTFVPAMPAFIAGVMNLRGCVVPVIDLSRRFSKKKSEITKKTSIVVVELENQDQLMEVGVVVDRVSEVLDVSEEDLEPAPAFGAKIRADFVKGMAKINDSLLVLIDVTRVLSIEELSIVNEQYQDAGEQKN